MINEVLGVGARYQQLLTRRFGILGGAPSPQITPELSPHITFDQPEDRILIDEFWAGGFVAQGLVAGQKAHIRLINPVGSNVLLVCEHCEFHDVTGGSTVSGASTPNVTISTAGLSQLRDLRAQNTGALTKAPVGVVAGAINVPDVSTQWWQRIILVNVVQLVDFLVLVAPGWSYDVQCGTVAHELRGSFWWREVPMAPGERGPF